MEDRTKHTYRVQIYDFVKDILVICPRCKGKALVQTGDFHTPKYTVDEIKVTCLKCGFNKVMENVQKLRDEKQKRGRILIFGAPIDPFFHLHVWLSAEISGELLWAYNLEHLEFLADHVHAKLRERNGLTHNVKSIGAQLPRWMTAAKNRDEILKAIEKLKQK